MTIRRKKETIKYKLAQNFWRNNVLIHTKSFFPHIMKPKNHKRKKEKKKERIEERKGNKIFLAVGIIAWFINI